MIETAWFNLPIKSAMKLVIELIGHLKGSLCYSLLSFCYFLFFIFGNNSVDLCQFYDNLISI